MIREFSRGNLIVQMILSLQMRLLITETVDLQTDIFSKLSVFSKASLSIMVSTEHGRMGMFNIVSFNDQKKELHFTLGTSIATDQGIIQYSASNPLLY